MAYCTKDDIEKSYDSNIIPELTDDDDGASTNNEIVTAAIARADAEINATLDGYLTVPFTTVPDMIKYISVDLAYFHLYKRRFNAEVPEWLRNNVNDARGMLAQIAAGELTVNADEQDSGAKMVTNKTSDDRMFTSEKLDAYFSSPF